MPSAHSPHYVTTTPYSERATSVNHPLSAYLLRLMAHKRSNLCLSADVSTTNKLLALANAAGPSIVVLKTHYDLVNNWDYDVTTGTGARLAQLARRHGFLIFEDRKFADIGSTVQMQYTEGTARIIEWSHITNVNMIPGKAVVAALADAAVRWKERKRYEVTTDISGGIDTSEDFDEDERGEGQEGEQNEHKEGHFNIPDFTAHDEKLSPSSAGRKASIVSITTVSQHFEPANSPRSGHEDSGDEVYAGLEEAPMDRGLLILAQMSSAGNFMTRAYTEACVAAAREHPRFVMGFVAQESLNSEPGEEFLTMTPGCQLPALLDERDDDDEAEVAGDGLGQQYNTPSRLIGLAGADIVIVGRGIIQAADPVQEAEHYRRKAWEAYEARVKV